MNRSLPEVAHELNVDGIVEGTVQRSGDRMLYTLAVKAAVCTRYGPPEVLQLQDVRDPVPGAKDVLIRIRATTVTPSDCYIRSMIPSASLAMRLIARAVIGFTRPRCPILGAILAGEIEAIGRKVSRFQVGDRVWAFTAQAHELLRPAHLLASDPQAPHTGAVEFR